MVTLCQVFGVHRSSYRYWKNRPEKPDGRRAVLRSQVLELHGISHGSAGARSIATMATRRGYQMGRWLAGRLMKELGLVSCQQPTHRYKRGGHEHVAMPKWVILYCRRWMEAPMQSCENGELITRTRGTPQGGVISPLLANLFLHYAFDLWMEREYRGVPFERYADDIVVHCSRMSDATRLKNRLSERFSEVGLVLNAGKTNIAYIDTFKRRNVATSFTFLGYDFKVRTLKNFKGERYRKCMPGASNAAMRKITETIKKWRIHRSTAESLLDFARRYNTIVRGWIEYYGKFWSRNFNYRLWSAMQSRLLKWMQSKYRLSNRKAQRKLTLVRKEYPKLFVHWYLLRASNE
ncbi:putative reverse transcriptase (plasmid) [Shigella boydii Sb227]|uniref:Reverse transcriptase n=3 Tax=Shigella TaxID=620 RepID=Q31SP0_SHIBS|nr:putative reverse transcriptase [Shigella boydii Sb227]